MISGCNSNGFAQVKALEPLKTLLPIFDQIILQQVKENGQDPWASSYKMWVLRRTRGADRISFRVVKKPNRIVPYSSLLIKFLASSNSNIVETKRAERFEA